MRLREIVDRTAIVLAVSGCASPGPGFVVSTVLPDRAAALEVVADLDGIPAYQVPRVPVSLATAGDGFTFVLSLPQSAAARSLLVALAARDLSGCLRARGVGQSVVGADAAAYPELSVLLSPDGLLANDGNSYFCKTTLPVITAVIPYVLPADRESMLHIDGWGFNPQSQVSIGGIPVTQAQWSSPTQMDVRAPVLGLTGMVPLVVQHPDGDSDSYPLWISM
jgi:hypothetical protein